MPVMSVNLCSSCFLQCCSLSYMVGSIYCNPPSRMKNHAASSVFSVHSLIPLLLPLCCQPVIGHIDDIRKDLPCPAPVMDLLRTCLSPVYLSYDRLILGKTYPVLYQS